MTDNASLTYELDAQIGKFASSFEAATKTASDSFSAITSAGRDAGDAVTQSINSAVEQVANGLTSLQGPAKQAGDTIGLLISGGIIAGAAGIATTLTELINTLAAAGDRADDLRLPVNIIQALNVAADQARVPTEKLNSALDQFTSVSKKSADDAKDFYKALDNIGASFGKAFQQAGTQADRLRVLMDAFHSTSDEVKRAQLAQEAFGSDSERLISVFSGGRDAMETYIEQVRALGLEIDESAVKRAQEAKSALSLLARVITDELSTALAQLIPEFKALLPELEQVAGAVRDFFAGFSAPENQPLATLKNDAAAAEGRLTQLQDRLKELDSFKPSTGLAGKIGKKFGLDVYAAPDSDPNSGGFAGFSLDIKAERERIEAEIAQTKKDIDGYTALIKQKEAEQDANKGKDGKEAPAFKPRPKLDTGGDDESSAFDRQVDSLNKKIAAEKADLAAIGLTNAAHQGLRAELALLAAAQRDDDSITNEQIDTYTKLRQTMSAQQALTAAGIKLNQDDAFSFNEVTNRMVQATAQLDRAKQKFQGINGVLQDAGNELVNVFDQAVLKGQSFQQVMVGVLQNIEKQLLTAALTGQGAFGKLFGTAGQNGGVGGIMGLFAGRFGGAHASGGEIEPNRVSLVGERGPELVVPRTSSTVIPNGKFMLSGGRGGMQQNNAIHVNITNTGPANHQDNQKLAEQVGRHVQNALDAHWAKNLRQQTRPGGVLFGTMPGGMSR